MFLAPAQGVPLLRPMSNSDAMRYLRTFFSFWGLAAAGTLCWILLTVFSRPEQVVVFFGDSLTSGYGLDDPATQSYPSLIAKSRILLIQ